MAAEKSFLKLSTQEVVLKVAGTAGSQTVTMAELATTSQEAVGPYVVNIVGVTWTGSSAGVITIARGGTTIMTLQSTPSGSIDFGGQTLPAESTKNTDPIVVTISGGQAECWIRLRKTSGYSSKIEPYAYGSYDDPTKVGS